jgi:hypothetical protein
LPLDQRQVQVVAGLVAEGVGGKLHRKQFGLPRLPTFSSSDSVRLRFDQVGDRADFRPARRRTPAGLSQIRKVVVHDPQITAVGEQPAMPARS